MNYKESPNDITSVSLIVFKSILFIPDTFIQCILVCIIELYHILWTCHLVVSGYWRYRHSLWTWLMKSRWEGTDSDLQVLLLCLVVLFLMRAYTSVTIEMWHNHLVTELVIKCCSFVVSLKTDIYLPWSQRVGERMVVWYENRRRGKKEASASPTIACWSHLWYSSFSVHLFIWKTNQTALLLKPRVRFYVYMHVCSSRKCVFLISVQRPFSKPISWAPIHQSKSRSSLGFTHNLTFYVKLMVLQTAVVLVPWQDVAYIQSDKCWFHFSTRPASVRVKYTI